MSKQPVLTVVTVVRNAIHVIDGCIRSVLAQDVEGLEYIVIDGASTDGTLEAIKKYGNAISQVVSEPDSGLYDAMNKGLRLANGRYIHFLNADDRYFVSDTLRTLLPKLSEDSVSYAQLVYVGEEGTERRLGAPFSWEVELRESHVPQPTLFVAKRLYEQVGEFDLRYRVAADYDMVLRLTRRYPAKYIAQPVTIMHAGGVSNRQMELAFREASLISRRYGRSGVGAGLTYLRRMAKWQIARRLPPVLIAKLRRSLGRE